MQQVLTEEDLDPWQHEAADFLYEHDGALAFIPVGGGKTAISLAALRALLADGVVKTALVLAPLRVASIVWPEELEKWQQGRDIEWSLIAGSPNDGEWDLPDWARARQLYGKRVALDRKIDKLRSKPSPSRSAVEQAMHDRVSLLATEKALAKGLKVESPLMISTYENIEWLCAHFPGGLPWDLIILDEGSRLSSHKSQRFKLMRKHTKDCAMLWDLTASPATEGLHKLWAQVSLVTKGAVWGKSFYAWRPKYFVPLDFKGFKWGPQLGAEDLIYKDLEGVAFTIDESVLPEKPPLTLLRITVKMTETERKEYDRMARDFVLDTGDGEEIAAVNKGVLTGKLRQLAQGFAYREASDDLNREPRDAYRFHRHKLEALEELVEELQGEPLIVGYDFQEDLRRILERWPDTPYLGAGCTKKQAADACRTWNEGKLPIFAIHPASGGHGLNLQRGGSQVCWYGMPWSRELYDQLIGRVWRRGQLKTCFVHHILMLDTVDDDVWDAVELKASFQEALAQGIQRLGAPV